MGELRAGAGMQLLKQPTACVCIRKVHTWGHGSDSAWQLSMHSQSNKVLPDALLQVHSGLVLQCAVHQAGVAHPQAAVRCGSHELEGQLCIPTMQVPFCYHAVRAC